jgi:hypothetical protein
LKHQLKKIKYDLYYRMGALIKSEYNNGKPYYVNISRTNFGTGCTDVLRPSWPHRQNQRSQASWAHSSAPIGHPGPLDSAATSHHTAVHADAQQAGPPSLLIRLI